MKKESDHLWHKDSFGVLAEAALYFEGDLNEQPSNQHRQAEARNTEYYQLAPKPLINEPVKA